MKEKCSLENIMIIGAMKSGTTFLFHYLSQHPEICPSIPKETNYFSQYEGAGYEQVDCHYLDLFDIDPSNHKFTLEGSTAYTKYPSQVDVPKRISDYGLNPKFIYILRNPIDRIKSHYNHIQGRRIEKQTMGNEHSINTSNYYLQIEQFIEYFKQDQILILDFDELIQNPKVVLKRIFAFIGASNFEINTDFRIKNKGVLTSPKRRKIMKNFHWIFTHLPKVSVMILDFFLPVKREKLTEEKYQEIFNVLRNDMIRLHEKYNVDVKKWGFNLNTFDENK